MFFRKTILKTLAACALVAVSAGSAAAQDALPAVSVSRQSIDDAWFTGPMLAPSANTLPPGHFLIEPYIFDVISEGLYDSHGIRRSTAHSNGFGNLTYINYGVAERFTIGLIPTAMYNLVSQGPSSSGVGFGDVTVQAQYRLTKFKEGSWIPTMSFAVQETFPTGSYDRLGTRTSDGVGAGAYTTTLAFYSQTYFWLRNQRILRMRVNVTQAFSTTAKVRDVSVYNTPDGFRGHASPGTTTLVDASWEYSLTRGWVLAADAVYRHQTNTHVAGINVVNSPPTNFVLDSGTSDAFELAPAIEYSWKSNIGVLLGVRLIPAGRNYPNTITPAIAINYVH
jgi:hypothetical protein